jgi:5,5'-dehydrodivanillate O-demethylase oxygenase subunit
MAAIAREADQGKSADVTPWTDFAHTGPGTLAGRYLRLFWQPVWFSKDIPAGRARPLRVMSEDFTLYRGEGGDVHLVAFRCAHRGTQLSTGWVEGDNLRCFYHGWMYDGNGQCVEQPAEPQPFCEKIKIRSYPVQEYLGMVFAYLGEGAPPELPPYREFEAEDAVLTRGGGDGDDGGGAFAAGQHDGVYTDYPAYRPCNYFNRLENSPDPVHLAFVHRRSGFTDSGLVGIPQPSGEETEYGFDIRAKRPDEGVRVTHWHMPNIIQRPGVGGGASLTWRLPIDDYSCMSLGVAYTPRAYLEKRGANGQRNGNGRGADPSEPIGQTAARILRGEMTTEEITSNFVGIQDWVAQIGQGVIAPRENDHLGRSDVLVLLLRKLWEREMRALHEGRPLKQWHRPEKVETVYGVEGV